MGFELQTVRTRVRQVTEPPGDLDSRAFRAAELRSEHARVTAILTVCAGLLALVLVRGFLSLAAGRHGEAWPFAVLLASMTAYEWWWLRFIKNAIGRICRRSRRVAGSRRRSLPSAAATRKT